MGNYHNVTQPNTATCYNWTGNQTVPIGIGCPTCRTGPCLSCPEISATMSGGSGIALQDTPQERSWTTYQSVSAAIPSNVIGVIPWTPGSIGNVSYNEFGFPAGYNIRLGCRVPYDPGDSRQSTQMFFNGQPFVYHYPWGVDPSRYVGCDPFGRFSSSRQGTGFNYTTSRWGNSTLGASRVHFEVNIKYHDSFMALGSGWAASVHLGHMFQEEYLDIKHRWGLIGSTRFTLANVFPPSESGYPGLVPPMAGSIQSRLPMWLWKPCISNIDTVRGVYQPIWGPNQTPIPGGSPGERVLLDGFDPSNPNNTCPSWFMRRTFSLSSMTVS